MAGFDLHSSADNLTERETTILRLLDEGLTDREIAAKLVITLGTVKWYNRQIYGKLGAAGRTQAVHRARELDLLQRGGPPAAPARLARLRHNLPAETTHFVGRRRELHTARQLLRTARLLTLTGSPGAGKTRLGLRLAAEVLAEFPQGAFFVNLAPLDNPAFVALAIADVLAVEERSDQPIGQTLREALQDQSVLLVLDNFEHLLPAATLVADLLLRAPGLKVLVTSREPLHLRGEQEYFIAPLELPDAQDSDPETLAQCEALALFAQQAKAVRPDFTVNDENVLDIAKICVRLDGLPLAIELAAAQSKLLNPHAILSRLANPLTALVNGARDMPARQRTLQLTIDWSYNLLDEGEKRLFARLGVFAAGWTLEAMEAVCCEGLALDAFDGLEALVNKSLVRQQEVAGEPRFEMLSTIREYALEQLEANGELEVIRRRHATYYTALAEKVERVLDGLDQRSALDNLELEHDNFRAVLGWSQAADPEPGLRLIAALGLCWQMRGHLLEGYRWSQSLLELGQQADASLRAKALYSASLLAQHLGEDIKGEQLGEESLGLARLTGDPATVAWSLSALGMALFRPNMTAEAFRHLLACIDEALAIFRAQNATLGIGKCLTLKGEAYRLQDQLALAMACYQEAVGLFAQLGNPAGMCSNLLNLGWVNLRLGDFAQAEACFRESQQLARQIRYKSLTVATLAGLAALAARCHQPEQAARLFGVVEAQQAIYRDALCITDQADYEPCVAAVRTELEPEAFARLWAEGQALTLEQAVARTAPAA